MHTKIKLLILVLYTLANLSGIAALAQRNFTATIQVPFQFEAKDATITYDNGKEQIKVKPEFRGGKLTVSDAFFSEYATIEISYPSQDPMRPYYKAFFITDKPASITFTATPAADNPLTRYKLKNAHDIDSKGAARMKDFVSEEEEDFFAFMAANQEKLGTSDSLVKVLFQKSERLLGKKVAYVNRYGSEYYSFWLFRRELAFNQLLDSDSLLATFNHAFPAKFKQSEEGLEVAKVLNGRNIKKGQLAPNFSATDKTGKDIKLSDFKGKFTLINFWASWCKPCLEEMPVITELRTRYPVEKLEIIFVTLDNNPALATKTIEKYKMTGVHVKGSADLVATYGAQAIPVVYLIDPEGRVIYSRDEERDYQLQLLPELLKKKI